jgi:hypothetical protein
METHMPVLYTFRDLNRSGYTVYEPTLTHLASISGIRHHLTIPYSKEENGIFERANKDVRNIRNMLADEECIPDSSQML